MADPLWQALAQVQLVAATCVPRCWWAAATSNQQQQLLQRQQQHVLHSANLQQVCAVCVCVCAWCPAGRQKLRYVKINLHLQPATCPPATPCRTTHRTPVLGEHSRPWQFCGENGKFLFDYLLHLVNFHVPGDKNGNNLLSHGPRPCGLWTGSQKNPNWSTCWKISQCVVATLYDFLSKWDRLPPPLHYCRTHVINHLVRNLFVTWLEN